MDWSVASWGGTGVCELVLTNGFVFWSTGRNGRPTFPLNPCMPGQICHCLLSLLLVWWPAGSASREKRASEPYAWSTCRVIAVADYKFYRFIGRNSIYNTAAYIVSPMLCCEHPNPTSVVCSFMAFEMLCPWCCILTLIWWFIIKSPYWFQRLKELCTQTCSFKEPSFHSDTLSVCVSVWLPYFISVQFSPEMIAWKKEARSWH